VVRVALLILLVAAAPLALICHALPQTEGLARLWWRATAACLAGEPHSPTAVSSVQYVVANVRRRAPRSFRTSRHRSRHRPRRTVRATARPGRGDARHVTHRPVLGRTGRTAGPPSLVVSERSGRTHRLQPSHDGFAPTLVRRTRGTLGGARPSQGSGWPSSTASAGSRPSPSTAHLKRLLEAPAMSAGPA
jgi:hypothetical protein